MNIDLNKVYTGNCLEFLKNIPDNSFDSIVTDPPYGISFMGNKWDYDVPSVEIWEECLRVLKPGGHLLAFAGTRTQHRMAVRIEDAGFEIRDMIAWVYGTGFPKSLDVAKAIRKHSADTNRKKENSDSEKNYIEDGSIMSKYDLESNAWDGWGTGLKPALEPITVARKTIVGNVAKNVLAYGVGGINIDACRVLPSSNDDYGRSAARADGTMAPGIWNNGSGFKQNASELGRWPANFIIDDSDEVKKEFEKYGTTRRDKDNNLAKKSNEGIFLSEEIRGEDFNYGHEISLSRFFYCAKASKSDRNAGLEFFDTKYAGRHAGTKNQESYQKNNHPTVKPTNLMRYLCRLVTPPGGLVFDPFAGSGSTGKACIIEGFKFVGCEINSDYADIANGRILHAVSNIKSIINESCLDQRRFSRGKYPAETYESNDNEFF